MDVVSNFYILLKKKEIKKPIECIYCYYIGFLIITFHVKNQTDELTDFKIYQLLAFHL